MNFLRVVLTLIISGSIWLLPHSRSLAAFPEKQLTIIVPYTAGGATDVLARIVATNMSALLGQAVVVENRPGASGSIGTRHVATAEPDGYTLLIANTLAHTASPALMKTNFGYDAVKSFRAVGFIGTNDYVLVVNPQFPAKTVGELVEVARANPGKYSFGSAGTGTSTHLAPALFLRAAGLELKHIPYKGTVVNEVIGGHVDVTMDNAVGVLPLVQAGRLRALATTGATRSNLFPNTPTLVESGFGAAKVQGNFGLLAPARTPDDVINKLSGALRASVERASAQLREMGMSSNNGSAAEYQAVLQSEQVKWTNLIKEARIGAE